MNAEMTIRKAINDGTHKLPNGALIIDWAGIGSVVTVLAKFRGEFVTWIVMDDGACYYGHYHGEDVLKAAREFKERVGE